MNGRERWLVDVARDVRRYLIDKVDGRGYLGAKHDDLFLARRLTAVLALYEDIEPAHDIDRHEAKAIILTDVPNRWRA